MRYLAENCNAVFGSRAAPGSSIIMLGTDEPLAWTQDDQGLVITIPEELTEHKPCEYAYCFKIEALL
jgi:hypothetical protein